MADPQDRDDDRRRSPTTGQPRGDLPTVAPPEHAAGGADSSPWETVPSNERPDPTRPPAAPRDQERGEQSP